MQMDSLLLIPTLPLLAALWIAIGFMFGWNRGEKGERETAFVAVGAMSLSCLAVLALAAYALFNGTWGYVSLMPWLQSGDYALPLSFMLDGLSLSFAAVVSVILLLVTRFAVNYLHREAGFQRFFLVLSLFSSAMLWLILAGSLLVSFIGWELAGVSSYLLIAYAWQRDTAVSGASRAFVTNRLGDAGFLFSMFLGLAWFGSVEWPALLQAHEDTSSLILALLLLGLLLAALIKSAQFPFSLWISRALEGPTPSSAVFYGSVMVHAGIFLLLRLEPLLEQVPLLAYSLVLLGALTVLYGWLGAQVQTDIKSSLLFATQVQTGLMLISIGLGWYTLALVHMCLHAIWRAYQFLHAPSFLQHTQWQAAPVRGAWLRRWPWLHTAALQRFWLESLENWLLVRPIRALGQEVELFDRLIIDRLTGTPAHNTMLSTLAALQAFQQGKLRLENAAGQGSGVLGKLMQWLAEQLAALEDRLLLHKGRGGLQRYWQQAGRYLDLIEELLSQPRYLVFLLIATLVVIL